MVTAKHAVFIGVPDECGLEKAKLRSHLNLGMYRVNLAGANPDRLPFVLLRVKKPVLLKQLPHIPHIFEGIHALDQLRSALRA